jgi:uncharacterized protein (DUF1697 family)
MRHVALLRGINVGGHNRVEMPRLAQVFTELGFSDVRTYINTGNVVFRTEAGAGTELARTIQIAIAERFGFDVKTLVRARPTIEAIAADLPAAWRNDKSMKSDVMFLMDDIAEPGVLSQLTIIDGVDDVRYSHGAILWRVDRAAQNRSGMKKLIGTRLYRQLTVRNCNTFRAIATLVSS